MVAMIAATATAININIVVRSILVGCQNTIIIDTIRTACAVRGGDISSRGGMCSSSGSSIVLILIMIVIMFIVVIISRRSNR